MADIFGRLFIDWYAMRLRLSMFRPAQQRITAISPCQNGCFFVRSQLRIPRWTKPLTIDSKARLLIYQPNPRTIMGMTNGREQPR
jgi:hypothetical protein